MGSTRTLSLSKSITLARKREFAKIEKDLEKRAVEKCNTVLIVEEADFTDDKFSTLGYHYLKEQCEYINNNANVSISVPKGRANGMKERLEEFAVVELRHIKKDKETTFLEGLLFLAISIISALCAIYVNLEAFQLFWIGSWAFGWYALDKLLFDIQDLRVKKRDIMQLLAATIVEQNK